MAGRVVLTHALLRSCLRQWAQDPARLLTHEVGLSRLPGGDDWLVRPTVAPSLGDTEPTALLTAQQAIQPLTGSAPVAVVSLPRQGRPAARLAHPDGRLLPAALRFVAPGLPEVPALSGVPAESTGAAGDLTDAHSHPPSHSRSRWSRTLGALGEAPWRRLASLRFCVVGCGRTGTVAALSLARMGACSFALIDPDTVEPHNLDGDGLVPNDIGRPKVEVLAEAIRALGEHNVVTPLQASVSALSVLPAVKQADVLLVASDNDGARWIAGLLATCYLKLLVDVGVAVLRPAATGGTGEASAAAAPPTAATTRGADIRLVVPGETCLSCFGGVADSEHVAATLRSMTDERRYQQERVWHRERAGSRRDLALTAAGLGIGLLLDFLRGQVEASTWLRLAYASDGVPGVESQQAGPATDCAVCVRAGVGDGVLTAPGGTLAELTRERDTAAWPTPRASL